LTQLIKSILSLAVFMFSSAHAVTDGAGWIRIPTSGISADVFYQPLSIRAVDAGKLEATSVINYKTSSGLQRSNIALTYYDCLATVKQDQYTREHDGFWGAGELLAESGQEQEWRTIQPGSLGMTILVTVCKHKANK
jgi:hypothetical protein